MATNQHGISFFIYVYPYCYLDQFCFLAQILREARAKAQTEPHLRPRPSSIFYLPSSLVAVRLRQGMGGCLAIRVPFSVFRDSTFSLLWKFADTFSPETSLYGVKQMNRRSSFE
jgi:hypothetical protein